MIIEPHRFQNVFCLHLNGEPVFNFLQFEEGFDRLCFRDGLV